MLGVYLIRDEDGLDTGWANILLGQEPLSLNGVLSPDQNWVSSQAQD